MTVMNAIRIEIDEARAVAKGLRRGSRLFARSSRAQVSPAHRGRRDRKAVPTGHFFRVLWWDPEHQVYPMNITNN